MHNKKIVLLIICITLFSSIKAQDQTGIAQNKFQLALVPQYLINNGMRIDFEYIFKNPKHVLLISPQFYYDKNDINYDQYQANYYEDEYEQLNGYGAGLHHKIAVSTVKTWTFYFTYGVEYAHFTINNKRWEWVSTTEEGMEYLKYELIDIEQNTDRFRFDLYMSIQYNYAKNMFFDFYMGMGAVYSLNKMNPDFVKSLFQDKMYGYAFNGMYLPIGFRFGFRF